MDRRSMLATGCLGVAAAWAWWTIRCHLVELKRELQEVKRSLVPLPRQPQPTAKRQWPNLSGVWEFDASRADLKAIDIYLRYMSTPMMIRPIFSYAMSRMKGFELKNDDEQHQALVEIPIPWMGAMKKGPFPLHASLKEAQARKVLIKNAYGGNSHESHHWEDHPEYGRCFVTTTSELPHVPPETTQISYFFLDAPDKCRLVWKCQRPDREECATYTFYGVRSAQPPVL